MDRRPPFPVDFRLILASQSPRRHSLLRDIEVPFIAVSSDVTEAFEGASADVLAERNALAKARYAALHKNVAAGSFVLGTDTLVTLDGRVMGKPTSVAEAVDMLAVLSGHTHQVISGVALLRTKQLGGPDEADEIRVAHSETSVTFLPMRQVEIDEYVASSEWKGKAGGYAIQGLAGLFVSEIRGEYSNVVGLPLSLVGRLFRDLGFDLLGRKWI